MFSDDPTTMEALDACFPCRPRPVPGELLQAYLHRVLRANGHDSLRSLHDGGTDAVGVRDFLQRMVRLSADELARLTEPSFDISQAQEDVKILLTPHIRWCPQCVKQEPVLLGRWLYRTTVVCTRHGGFMRDECPHCHASQRASGFTDICCECGASICRPVSDDVPEPLLQLQIWLDEALVQGQQHPALFNLHYHQAAKLAHYLGILACSGHQGSLQESASSRRMPNDRVLMNEASDILTRWPGAFVTRLALAQAAPATNSLQRDFGNLYRVLYRSLKGDAYQFLRDIFESYVNAHWTGMLSGRNKRLSEQTRRSHPRMTIKQAARLADATPAQLKRLRPRLQAHEIAFPSGRRLYTLTSSHLDQVKGVNLTQAADRLHLPQRRIRGLIAAGVIQPDISPVSTSASAWFISEEHLRGLFFHPTGQKEGGVALHHVLRYWKLSEVEFIDLTKALLAQKLDVVNQPCGDSIPLGLVELSREDLRRWRSGRRVNKSSSVSVDEAATVLGIKQQVAYQLVYQGLLPSSQMLNRAEVRVRSVDLQDFQRTYVSLAELARSRKTSPKALLGKLPCEPVTGPTVDGTRQYFYRIADLMAAEITEK
ncbi:hypothetical protein CCAE64S_01311 [Castellaniella caeni]